MMAKIRWAGVFLAMCAAVAQAEIEVRFNYTGEDISSLKELTLNFSVGEGGVVSMDASTSSTLPERVKAVDAWDSANVGTVDPSLTGTMFSLTAVGSRWLTLGGYDGGCLGVSGRNAWRIDDHGQETLTWTFSHGTANLVARFSTVFYGGGLNNKKSSMKLCQGDVMKTYDIAASKVHSGFFDIRSDGFVMGSGDSLIFTTDEADSTGYGLAGFSFSVWLQEPVTVGMSNQEELGSKAYRRG